MSSNTVTSYKKKNLYEHILSRSEIYVGGKAPIQESAFVFNEDKITQKPISYSPAFLKIFDEILVNAIDQSVRDTSVTFIKVDINRETGEIAVMNNGDTSIPLEMHPEYKIYLPELIFGNLLTSSNYDDNEQKIVGGTNGLGSKLTNIFSKKFTVSICDGSRVYLQMFSCNMSKKTEPKFKKHTKKFTKISFIPDFEKFGITHIDDDHYSLLIKRVYDTVACVNSKVSVYLDSKKLTQKSIKDYVKLYTSQKMEYISIGEPHKWDIVAGPGEGQNISFVNGICTTQNGKHVDYVLNQIVKKLSDYILSKKKVEVKSTDIKNNMTLFVRGTVVNPAFSSQTKETLVTPVKSLGTSITIPDDFIQKLFKLIGEDVMNTATLKIKKNIDKNISKKSKITIPKLNDANNAGTSKSNLCTLILTEGDSASTFAISGLSVVGRDNYGVFSLRGKLLNVREATMNQLEKNEEIMNIKKIMNLNTTRDYKTEEERKTMRYSSITILADADHDGVHIMGLVINFIHHFWPSLANIPGFIRTIKTPIVKVTKGSLTKEFYNEADYHDFIKDNKNWVSKYYKGLGTSTAQEAKQIFKDIKKNTRTFVDKQNTNESIVLAFDKKKADDRKKWLSKLTEEYSVPDSQNQISYDDFINKDLIHFSNYDNVRSIPHLMDGLKPSQRKVLFAGFKRNLTKEMKVAQFGAAVGEMTQYHHGEQSLFGTIINMAQNYTGSNNINLFEPIGQFGTRTMLGKDAASPRYIYTRLTDQAFEIFNKEDFPILNYLEEDGQSIEPEFFSPTIPMILVNGTTGIGTGYSTNIPCYNPDDVRENVRLLLEGKEMKKMVPWYRGFKGKITETKENVFLCEGIAEKLSNGNVRITEIPLNTSIDLYKQFLESFDDFIVKNSSTEEDPDFEIKNKNGDIDISKLKLSCNINATNMHLWYNKEIKKYNSPLDIITDFVEVKLQYTEKRRVYLQEKYKLELEILKNKKRFLTEIMEDKIVVYKKTKVEIESMLTGARYQKIEDSYSYLTSMNIASFNKENLDALHSKIDAMNQNLEYINKTSAKDLVLREI